MLSCAQIFISDSPPCVIGFMVYAVFAIGLTVYLVFWVAPQYGQTNIMVYIGICSLIGSLSVMGCKGLSIAIKLTASGDSQLENPLAWLFAVAVAVCIAIQMNYLNKALDIFNTSIVSPIYYVMFTTLTITASAILFKEWDKLTTVDVIGSLCGFITIIFGVFLLHAFKDLNFNLTDLINLTNRPNGGTCIATNGNNSGHTLVSFPPQPRQNVSTSIQMEGLQNAMTVGRTGSLTPRSLSARSLSAGSLSPTLGGSHLGGSHPGNSESEAESETIPFIQCNHVG